MSWRLRKDHETLNRNDAYVWCKKGSAATTPKAELKSVSGCWLWLLGIRLTGKRRQRAALRVNFFGTVLAAFPGRLLFLCLAPSFSAINLGFP